MTSGMLMPSSCSVDALSTITVSKPVVMAYSSDASTLRDTCLHFVDDQWMMFDLSVASAMTTMYPICDDRSLLFAKEASENYKLGTFVVWFDHRKAYPRDRHSHPFSTSFTMPIS